MVMVNTSDSENSVYIMTANLDGETNLKQRKVNATLAARMTDKGNEDKGGLRGTLVCDLPNKDIGRFKGLFLPSLSKEGGGDSNDRVALDKSNVVLRGCQIRNTAWVEGVVVYTGGETKMMMNASKPRAKLSTMATVGMRQLLWIAAMQFCYCAVGTALCIGWVYWSLFSIL